MKFLQALLHFSVFWPNHRNDCGDSISGINETKEAAQVIPQFIHKYSSELGLDPLDLPDISKKIKLPAPILSITAQMDLRNGTLSGLSDINAIRNIGFDTTDDLVKFKCVIDFNELSFNYSFTGKILGLGPTGYVYGDIKNISVAIVVAADYSNISSVHFYVDKFKITETGSLNVNLDVSPKILDIFINPIINIVAAVIKDEVMKVVEGKVKNIANDILSKVHVGYG